MNTISANEYSGFLNQNVDTEKISQQVLDRMQQNQISVFARQTQEKISHSVINTSQSSFTSIKKDRNFARTKKKFLRKDIASEEDIVENTDESINDPNIGNHFDYRA